MKKSILIMLLAASAFVLSACTTETAEETTAAETVSESAASSAVSTGDEYIDSLTNSTGTTDAEAINAIVDALEVVEPATLGTVSKLGDYKGLELSVAEHIVVSDEEVEEYINENILYDYTEEVTGPIQEGDIANIDYEGKKDGVAFEGGTSQGYDLEIGSGNFIDGFESGLIGKKAGETVDLNLKFPDNYSAEELAGQDVVFTVKINSVTRQSELTDAIAQEIGDYATAADLRAAVKEALQGQQDLEEREELYAQAVNLVLENSEVEASDEAVEYTTNSYMKNYATQVQNNYGIDLGSLLNMYSYSIEEFMDSYEEYARESVKQRLVLQEIAKKENISITDADIEEFAKVYGYDMETLQETVGAELLEKLVLEDLANAFIVENSTVTYTAAE